MAPTEARATTSAFYNCIAQFAAGLQLNRATHFHGKSVADGMKKIKGLMTDKQSCLYVAAHSSNQQLAAHSL